MSCSRWLREPCSPGVLHPLWLYKHPLSLLLNLKFFIRISTAISSASLASSRVAFSAWRKTRKGTIFAVQRNCPGVLPGKHRQRHHVSANPTAELSLAVSYSGVKEESHWQSSTWQHLLFQLRTLALLMEFFFLNSSPRNKKSRENVKISINLQSHIFVILNSYDIKSRDIESKSEIMEVWAWHGGTHL